MELTTEQINENFEKFISLLETNVKREGVDKLIKWFRAKDTKIAPASTKYHCAFAGGLIYHCLNVYNRLKRLIAMEYPTMVVDENGEMKQVENACPYDEETITIVALLHDISKVEFYEIQERNAKNEKGEWIKVPFYSVRDESQRLIFDTHPVNSYYMITKFIGLKYEEELAIVHHEGAFDTGLDGIKLANVMNAYKRSPLGLLLHQADMLATCIDEVEA